MILYHQNLNGNSLGQKKPETTDEDIAFDDIDEMFSDGWANLEDELTRKKKIRIKSKYSEKRYIP